jgi:type I restriction enzyme S subunit
MKLAAYPEYKDTQLPWLRKSPSHWEIKRGKSIFQPIDQRSATGQEELLTVSSARGVVPRRTAKVTMFKAESYLGYKLCWPGDLVINSLWAWACGLGVSQHHGIISSAYGVYRIRSGASMTPAFVHELVRSSPFNWELKVRSKGIWISRLQLTDESFLDAPFPMPPSDEQSAIVRFLTHTDIGINHLIRTKRRLIELLNEQKQVIIQRAVTRGLNPNAALKPSGIAWLGEIPKQWELWQIGHFSQIGNGSTPLRANPAYWSNGSYPWLNSSCVNHSPVTEAKQFVTPVALQECHLPRVPAGSVLVAITGQGKTRGTAAVLRIEATINQHMAYITPSTKLASADYLQLFLSAAYRELRRISDDSGSTKGALTCGDVSHFKVALPPVDEQQKIIVAVQQQTKTLDAAVARAAREIELIREYRTRLVADVVTGQLDVRAAAAKLPADLPVAEAITEIEADDAEEPEELATVEQN